MDEEASEQPVKQHSAEHLKPYRFKPGQSGNPGGRPKGGMKDYLTRKFVDMTDEEKEDFLITRKVSGKDQIELGEGKPKQDLDVKGEITSKIINVDE